MVFKQWIEQRYGRGGVKVVAAYLNVSRATVYAWCQLSRFPSNRRQQVIAETAGSQLDLTAWRREYLAKQEQAK